MEHIPGERKLTKRISNILSSEAANGFGQWLSPEDAERINKSCNSIQDPRQRIKESQDHPDQFLSYGEAEMFSDVEDEEDLKAAIASSLMDSFPSVISAEPSIPQNDNQISKEVTTTEADTLPNDQCNKKVKVTEASSDVHDLNNQQGTSAAGVPQDENQNTKENSI